jgi:TetR/AcrR family fatty acid metabolism transcriptional regulator
MRTMNVPISLKERQRHEREILILQAAEEAFSEKGYYETSMDEIAARVGVAKGTVYVHFSCKEALIVAIFTRDMELFVKEIEGVVALESTARTKLQLLLNIMLSRLRHKRSHCFTSIYNGVDMLRLLSEKRSDMHALWGHLATKIALILEEGKAAGELNPALPTKVMLLAFFSLLSPHVSEHLLLQDEVSSEEFAGYIETLLFNGISVK